MQRDVNHIVVVQLQAFGEQAVAHGQVGFGLHAVHDVVHALVAVAAQVVAAIGTGGLGARQRLQGVQRIERGHAPAQQRNAGLVPLGHGVVGHGGQRAQLGLDADARPHRGDGLAQFFVLDDGVVAAGKVHLKAVFVARISQQCLGGIGVEGQALVHGFCPAVDQGRDDGASGLGQPPHRHALQRGGVDGLVQRLAHAQVLERVLALDVAAGQLVAELVQRQVHGAVFHHLHHLELGVGLDARQVLDAGVAHHVHLAREQRGNARGFGLDGGVGDFGDVAIHLARVPPVRVGGEDDLLVGHPFLQHKRAGAHGVAVGIGFFLALDVLGLHRVVLLGPGTAHHAQLGQLVEQHGVGVLQEDVDGLAIHLGNAVHALGVDGVGGGLAHRALQRIDHVVRRHGRAVAELHALAQLEAHLRGADLLPRGGQHRFHLQRAAVEHDQRLVHRAVDAVAQGTVLRMDVHGLDIAGTSPLERFCHGGQNTGCQGDGGRRQHRALELHSLNSLVRRVE